MIVRASFIILVGAVAPSCGPSSPESIATGEVEPFNEVRWSGTLADPDQTDIAVRELLFAPGWTAPRHFHNSDLFIYVLAGDFEVIMEGEPASTYSAGQALEMRTEAHMTARNVSDSEPLRLVVFQVGQTLAPFVVPDPGE